MRTRLLPILVALLGIGSFSTAAEKPNVVLFVVDDMGWMDSGAYGSQYYQTPHIDAFARQSMRFTDAYAMPLCSPTRASILTGQHSSRHGITAAHGHLRPAKPALQEKASPNSPWLMPESGSYLDPAEHYTLAEALRDAGYRTAHIGKWHLGLNEKHWPEHYGFDVTFHCSPDTGPPSYFSPYGVFPPGTPVDSQARQRVGNITDGPPGEHIVDRQAQEAEKFLEANQDRPFFLNLSLYGVHGPWQHKEEYTAEFAKTTDPRGVQGNPVMASMLRSVDECFGRVLAKLDQLGLTENTIVIFYSDNGGNVQSWSADDRKADGFGPDHSLYEMVASYRKWSGGRPPTNNLPLRDGKGKLYEGGTRVPLMVRWPGHIKPGTTSDAIVGCIDLYPTILDLADLPLPQQQTIDGLSIGPVLRQTGELERDAYFIWFPHLVPGVSVRQGDWKLIRRFTERPEDYEGLHELFNLKDDLGETTNLAANHPEKVKELDALIDGFVADTGALYPVPNPAFRTKPAK
jgi:arylsulfatase A-like enzyme